MIILIFLQFVFFVISLAVNDLNVLIPNPTTILTLKQHSKIPVSVATLILNDDLPKNVSITLYRRNMFGIKRKIQTSYINQALWKPFEFHLTVSDDLIKEGQYFFQFNNVSNRRMLGRSPKFTVLKDLPPSERAIVKDIKMNMDSRKMIIETDVSTMKDNHKLIFEFKRIDPKSARNVNQRRRFLIREFHINKHDLKGKEKLLVTFPDFKTIDDVVVDVWHKRTFGKKLIYRTRVFRDAQGDNKRMMRYKAALDSFTGAMSSLELKQWTIPLPHPSRNPLEFSDPPTVFVWHKNNPEATTLRFKYQQTHSAFKIPKKVIIEVIRKRGLGWFRKQMYNAEVGSSQLLRAGIMEFDFQKVENLKTGKYKIKVYGEGKLLGQTTWVHLIVGRPEKINKGLDVLSEFGVDTGLKDCAKLAFEFKKDLSSIQEVQVRMHVVTIAYKYQRKTPKILLAGKRVLAHNNQKKVTAVFPKFSSLAPYFFEIRTRKWFSGGWTTLFFSPLISVNYSEMSWARRAMTFIKNNKFATAVFLVSIPLCAMTVAGMVGEPVTVMVMAKLFFVGMKQFKFACKVKKELRNQRHKTYKIEDGQVKK